MAERIRKAYRFPQETVDKIADLEDWLTSTATAVIVRAVNELWEREFAKGRVSLTMRGKLKADEKAVTNNHDQAANT